MQDAGDRKRDRSDESCDASTELEMTTAQQQTCKRMVANAYKYQGLAYIIPTMTTIKVTNVRQVYATIFRDFEFNHGDDNPNGEQPTSDEDDDGDDVDENGQGYTIVVTEFQKRGLPHAHIPPPQVEHTGGKPGDHQPHMDKPAVSSSSIKDPKSKPKTRQRDPEVVAVDSL